MGRREEEQEVRTEVSHQRGHSADSIMSWDLYERLEHRRTLELWMLVYLCVHVQKKAFSGFQTGFGCFLPVKRVSDGVLQPRLQCVNKQGRLC